MGRGGDTCDCASSSACYATCLCDAGLGWAIGRAAYELAGYMNPSIETCRGRTHAVTLSDLPQLTVDRK